MPTNHNPYAGYPNPNQVDPVEVANRVPSGTAKEVLGWVGDDKDRAERALEVEMNDDDPRVTLVKNLEKIIDAGDDE